MKLFTPFGIGALLLATFSGGVKATMAPRRFAPLVTGLATLSVAAADTTAHLRHLSQFRRELETCAAGSLDFDQTWPTGSDGMGDCVGYEFGVKVVDSGICGDLPDGTAVGSTLVYCDATIGTITVDCDTNKQVTWTSTFGIDAVLHKSGSDVWVTYDPAAMTGTASGEKATSHVSLCWGDSGGTSYCSDNNDCGEGEGCCDPVTGDCSFAACCDCGACKVCNEANGQCDNAADGSFCDTDLCCSSGTCTATCVETVCADDSDCVAAVGTPCCDTSSGDCVATTNDPEGNPYCASSGCPVCTGDPTFTMDSTTYSPGTTVTTTQCPGTNFPSVTVTAKQCNGSSLTVTESAVSGTTNECGDSQTQEFTVTDCDGTYTITRRVNFDDNEIPTFFSTPDNADLECNANTEPAATGTPMASDNCAVSVTHADTSQGDACNRTVSRVWTAKDDCGNMANHTQTITVSDTTAPVFDTDSFPDDIDIQCRDLGECGVTPTCFGSPTATDDCGNDVTISHTDMTTSGDTDPFTQFVRKWTVSDVCGNSNTDQTNMQTVTIHDTCDFYVSDAFSGKNINVKIAITNVADMCGTDIDGVYILVEVDDENKKGDIRGIFFQAAADVDEASITVTGEDVTDPAVIAEGAVVKVEKDSNMQGGGKNAAVFDVGVEIGTSGMSGDDISQTEIKVCGLSTIDFESGQVFGIRLTSVGPDGDREYSSKVTGVADCSCLPSSPPPPPSGYDCECQCDEMGGVIEQQCSSTSDNLVN